MILLLSIVVIVLNFYNGYIGIFTNNNLHRKGSMEYIK